MNINVSRNENVLSLELEGRLDAFGVTELQKVIDSNLDDDCLCVIFIMEKVSYISSAALRVFLTLQKNLMKKNGTIVLIDLQKYCENVIDIAGFSGLFPYFDNYKKANNFCINKIKSKKYYDDWDNLEVYNTEHGSMKIIPGSDEKGKVYVLGHVKDVLYSTVSKDKIFSKLFSETEYSIGLGALGDDIDDFFNIMGEMITIGGTMVWLPTDGHNMPDFLIPKLDKGSITLRTAFNVSLKGSFNESIMFKSNNNRGTSIGDLYRALFDMAKKRRSDFKGVIGLVVLADFSEVYGSEVKKAPVDQFAPENKKMIVDESNLKNWFSVDTVAKYINVTALMCGIGADLTSDLSYDKEKLNSVFYIHPSNVGSKTEMLHNHAVVFDKLDFSEPMVDISEEIKKTVEKGKFINMCHLLDSTKISRAFIGITYIQNFERDRHVD